MLERIGERLASSLELSVTLSQVAETLVPQFADHCFIDLLQGDKLVRRAQLHSRGWMPEPGSWALVGEQITYPAGHFCQQAMARMDTVIVEDMAEEQFPRAEPRQRGDLRRRRAHLGHRGAAGRPRRAARGDQPGAVRADRAPRAALQPGRPRFPQRRRQPGRGRHRQRDAVRGGAPHRAGLPDQPAAARPARAGRAGGGLQVRAGQAAGDPRPGHPDPGRRRLVRHHPAVGGPGRHRHRGRRGPRCPRGRGDGPAAGRAAGLRPGRQAARRDPAPAG